MANQVQGVPAPAPLQVQQYHKPHKHCKLHVLPQIPQAPSGQPFVHLTGQILSQNFQANLVKMHEHIYFTPMIGWTHIILLMESKFKDFLQHSWVKLDYGTNH